MGRIEGFSKVKNRDEWGMSLPTHLPQGDPCTNCGQNARNHRVYHKYIGTGPRCESPNCGLPPNRHKVRKDVDNRLYIGLDGEGQGRDLHRYVMLAANNEAGDLRMSTEEAPDGLTTVQCLDFILSLPRNARIFAYGFNYDLTKMLTDLDNKSIYRLFRPETRRRPPQQAHIPIPMYVRWKPDGGATYLLNLQGSKFTVWGPNGEKRTVWDVLKFYQSRFVKALLDWKISDEQKLERMQYMKEHRSEFDHFGREEVLDYCLEECQCLAQLVHKLVDAHEQAGLKLKTFYGAGSTGGLILKKMGIGKMKRETPPEMRDAVSRAFFGGRFEHRVIGSVAGPLWSYDISSAYPYQTRFLPCLDHGRWELTSKRSDLEGTNAALVRYRLHDSRWESTSWAPFPFRDAEGSICFPSKSGGGWIYKDEFIQGERLFRGVEFAEAWIYKTDCQCVPFHEIPEFYLQRLRLGKEGAGIVLKLGPNSVYGKLAQSLGTKPPYQCWLWAGMITSGCRAQILELMGLHNDKSNLLAIATDGIYTRERISTPTPKDTGTFKKLDGSINSKPLGGWEEKETKSGVFFARPGIYFENGADEEVLQRLIRARGIGRAELVRNVDKIRDGWKAGAEIVELEKELDRFCGAKSSTWKTEGNSPLCYVRSKDYGQWVKRSIALSLHPMPKRATAERVGDLAWLTLRECSGISAPYERAIHGRNAEAVQLQMAELEAIEQPDCNLVNYDINQDGFWG